MKTDGLAQKLYEAYEGAPADAWPRVHPSVSARWEQVAAVARDAMMRSELAALDWLIKACEADPEAAPFMAGMRFLAESKRNVLAKPIEEVEDIAMRPRA